MLVDDDATAAPAAADRITSGVDNTGFRRFLRATKPGYDRAVAKRKAFDPFSPELLVASLVVGVGLLWLVKRAAAPKDPGTPGGVDDQGRPIPPIPPID